MKAVADARQGLEYRYDQFAKLEQPWGFCKGLADYIAYARSIPQFKKVIAKEFARRKAEYDKLEKLEQQTIKELRKAEDDLLELIDANKIDAGTFSQDMSFIPLPPLEGKRLTVLDQLASFESGTLSISGPYSGNLERFIFDIAANLWKLGYRKELGKYVVSDTEYAKYYRRINGSDSSYIAGNVHGNFVFSKTWPKRFEQERHIEAGREIEVWGSFESIIIFWKAWNTSLESISLDQILRSAIEDREYPLDSKYAVELLHLIQDLKNIKKNRAETPPHGTVADLVRATQTPRAGTRLKDLRIDDIRIHLAIVHGQLLEVADVAEPKNLKPVSAIDIEAIKKALGTDSDRVWRQKIDDFIEETKEFIEEYRADKYDQESIDQGECWWKSGDRPIYDPEKKIILLCGRECDFTQGSKDQRTLCKAVFSKPFGEWLYNYEVNPPLESKQERRGLYDVGCGLNRKTRQDFGVKIFDVGIGRIRLKKELFS